MKLNALWTIEYATNHGDFGTGVAVLVDGNVYGGDTNYCYEGAYERQGGEIVARVKLFLHNGRSQPDGATDEAVSVLMRGRAMGEELELTGVLEHEPNTKLFIHMQRRSSVPAPQAAGAQSPAHGQAVDDVVAAAMGGDKESPYLIDEAADRLPLY
ncbi:MAG: hypothetical protein OET44_05920 [Gammaproteobacteria bacterium]|nr:hypothetical protein [Gammaproteobacteria bacterium]